MSAYRILQCTSLSQPKVPSYFLFIFYRLAGQQILHRHFFFSQLPKVPFWCNLASKCYLVQHAAAFLLWHSLTQHLHYCPGILKGMVYSCSTTGSSKLPSRLRRAAHRHRFSTLLVKRASELAILDIAEVKCSSCFLSQHCIWVQ